MKEKEFNVLIWNFNTDNIEHYNILPYLRKCVLKDGKKITDIDELRKFIIKESRYMWGGRCEWEMICHCWPVRKNDYKIDVHEQVMMNIDIITEILWNEIFA